MKKVVFEGVCTALVTPFKNGEVDYCALKILLERQILSGVSAVVILGTTGEPSCLSGNEKEKIIKTAIEYCKGRIKVLVGCGSNNTQLAIENYNQAESLGADGALIVTPYYNKCTQDGIVEHYRQISNSGSLPIIAYNVPSRTGVNIEVATVSKLAEIDNICGIKEASGNISQVIKYFSAVGNKLSIYSGDDALNYIFMTLGGAGTISVLSNLLPKETKSIIDYCNNNEYQRALKMQTKLQPVIDALFLEVNPIPIKASMEYIGLCCGDVRLPLTRMTEQNFNILKREINKYWDKNNDSL